MVVIGQSNPNNLVAPRATLSDYPAHGPAIREANLDSSTIFINGGAMSEWREN